MEAKEQRRMYFGLDNGHVYVQKGSGWVETVTTEAATLVAREIGILKLEDGYELRKMNGKSVLAVERKSRYSYVPVHKPKVSRKMQQSAAPLSEEQFKVLEEAWRNGQA